jgi:hypothetical protein
MWQGTMEVMAFLQHNGFYTQVSQDLSSSMTEVKTIIQTIPVGTRFKGENTQNREFAVKYNSLRNFL